MIDIHADHGTVLPVGATALVVTPDGELTFYLPNGDETHSLPRRVQLLAAVLIRSDDVDWVDEAISILDEQSSV